MNFFFLFLSSFNEDVSKVSRLLYCVRIERIPLKRKKENVNHGHFMISSIVFNARVINDNNNM